MKRQKKLTKRERKELIGKGPSGNAARLAPAPVPEPYRCRRCGKVWDMQYGCCESWETCEQCNQLFNHKLGRCACQPLGWCDGCDEPRWPGELAPGATVCNCGTTLTPPCATCGEILGATGEHKCVRPDPVKGVYVPYEPTQSQ